MILNQKWKRVLQYGTHTQGCRSEKIVEAGF